MVVFIARSVFWTRCFSLLNFCHCYIFYKLNECHLKSYSFSTSTIVWLIFKCNKFSTNWWCTFLIEYYFYVCLNMKNTVHQPCVCLMWTTFAYKKMSMFKKLLFQLLASLFLILVYSSCKASVISFLLPWLCLAWWSLSLTVSCAYHIFTSSTWICQHIALDCQKIVTGSQQVCW